MSTTKSHTDIKKYIFLYPRNCEIIPDIIIPIKIPLSNPTKNVAFAAAKLEDLLIAIV